LNSLVCWWASEMLWASRVLGRGTGGSMQNRDGLGDSRRARGVGSVRWSMSGMLVLRIGQCVWEKGGRSYTYQSRTQIRWETYVPSDGCQIT
jgi:hypothetical protein